MSKIIRIGEQIETGSYEYGVVIISEKVDEIPNAYAEAVLDWVMNAWDWESVVTKAENRAEDLELVVDHPGLLCYNLSKEDLVGLFGGKYGGSPGEIPGFLDKEYKKNYATDAIADGWSDIQAYAYIPVTRFSDEVLDELRRA